MDAVSTVLFGTIIYAITRMVRYLKAKDWNAALTLAIVWVAAVVVVFVAGESDFDAVDLTAYGLGEQTLGELNSWSKVLLGIALGSFASFGNDLLGSLDGTRSTSAPKLMPENDWSPNEGTDG